jgi:hypothetical protein
MLPIFFYHNAAQSLAHKGFRRIVTPPASRVKEEKTMNEPKEAIKVLNLDPLGIVAGIIDEMELVEEVNFHSRNNNPRNSESRTSHESNDFEWTRIFKRAIIHIRVIFCRKSNITFNRKGNTTRTSKRRQASQSIRQILLSRNHNNLHNNRHESRP